MVGGFRRLALVRGVSSSVRGGGHGSAVGRCYPFQGACVLSARFAAAAAGARGEAAAALSGRGQLLTGPPSCAPEQMSPRSGVAPAAESPLRDLNSAPRREEKPAPRGLTARAGPATGGSRLPQAAPGCPHDPASRRGSHWPRAPYRGTALGRGVADLGRTYAGAARRDGRAQHDSASPRRRRGTINIDKLKTTGERGGTCDSPELSRRPRPLLELELPRGRGRAVRRPPLEVPPPRVRRLRQRLGPERSSSTTSFRPLRLHVIKIHKSEEAREIRGPIRIQPL